MEDFYRIKRLPPYVFTIVNDLKTKARARGEDIIDLGMGNPDQPTPKHIVDKLVEAARNPKNHRYSASKGITRLRRAVTSWYRDRYSVELDPETETIATIGAKEGMAHLALAVLQPGDGVLVPNPTYPIHSYSVVIADGDLRSVPLVQGDDFFARLTETVRLSWPKAKMLILSFPHNPTTLCVERDFFVKVVDFAREHGLMVVHDFAYADFGYDGYRPPSFLEVPGAKEVGVEIFSLSKSYNMPGWRMGFVCGNPADDPRARAHQVLPRLRRVPAHPDREHHRARGRPEGGRGDRRAAPEAARRARGRAQQDRLVGPQASGDDVRVGAHPRRVPRHGLARVLQDADRRSARSRSRRASASESTARAMSGSPSSRTSTASSRPCAASRASRRDSRARRGHAPRRRAAIPPGLT